MIPINFDNSWYPYVYDLFHNDPKIKELKSKIVTNSNLNPKLTSIFRPFNININDIKGIIINNKPADNSNGLLFGTKSNNNLQLSNLYVNLSNTLYKDKEFSLDHTLENLVNQGFLLMNLNLTSDLELSNYYKYFTLSILKIVFDKHPNTPILAISNEVKEFLQPFNLHHVIYSIAIESDNFILEDCLVNYNQLLNFLNKFQINFKYE